MTGKRVYAFMSVKGGVGKTALAVLSAVGFARRGGRASFLDLDLTGTSIADGLALRAPDLLGDDGELHWEGLGRDALSREATIGRLVRRGHADPEHGGLSFVNDILVGGHPLHAEAQAWHHPEAPGVRWYPSSGAEHDTLPLQQAMFDPNTAPDLVARITTLLHDLVRALPERGVLFVDLPPGMFGFSSVVQHALPQDDGAAMLYPVLVTTPDRHDLARSAEQYGYLYPTVTRGLSRWILNRNRRPRDEVVRDMLVRAPPALKKAGIGQLIRDFGWSDAASLIFQRDRLDLDDAEIDRLMDILGLTWLLQGS